MLLRNVPNSNNFQMVQREIMMGAGKSAVLTPLLAAMQASSSPALSVVVLTDELYVAGSANLARKVALLGCRPRVLEYARARSSVTFLAGLQSRLNEGVLRRDVF